MITARSRFVSVKVEEKNTLSWNEGGCHKFCSYRGAFVIQRNAPLAHTPKF
jgi:hypothetical protein